MEKTEHVFAIEDGVRYTVILYDVDINPEELNRIKDTLEKWWKTDEKFLVWGTARGNKIRFERI